MKILAAVFTALALTGTAMATPTPDPRPGATKHITWVAWNVKFRWKGHTIRCHIPASGPRRCWVVR